MIKVLNEEKCQIDFHITFKIKLEKPRKVNVTLHFITHTLAQILTNISTVNLSTDPKFSAPIANVTAAVGREAILTCQVVDLGSYKVIMIQ